MQDRMVLAFGDSLTWGAIPGGGGKRHAFEDRWPNVLESRLSNVRLVTEGLIGRSTCFDDPESTTERNGARILPTLLGSHAPLALVIMMLGANDLKPRICGTADGAATGMRCLVEIIRSFPFGNSGPAPDLLLIAPPRFTNRKLNDEGPAGNRSIAESELLPSLYHQIARDCGGAFFDAGTVATASPIDGVHLDAMNTRAIGEALVPIVVDIFRRRR